MKLCMFQTVPLSVIRSFSLYTQQWYMSLLCVQWQTPVDGQRNCPKHVEFHSKNKFEKLVHLVGFIIRKECGMYSSVAGYNLMVGCCEQVMNPRTWNVLSSLSRWILLHGLISCCLLFSTPSEYSTICWGMFNPKVRVTGSWTWIATVPVVSSHSFPKLPVLRQ
jgi:hypothetical protein